MNVNVYLENMEMLEVIRLRVEKFQQHPEKQKPWAVIEMKI